MLKHKQTKTLSKSKQCTFKFDKFNHTYCFWQIQSHLLKRRKGGEWWEMWTLATNKDNIICSCQSCLTVVELMIIQKKKKNLKWE